jgi:alkylhydroperoxidase family enzyme
MTARIPRFSFDGLPAEVAEALRPKFERLGYLGEFFAATAHQPAALKAFIDFTELSKGELDMRLVELIALTVATMKAVAYEKNQHERLAFRLGYGREWVAAVEALAPEDQDLLSPDEKCVQKFVIAAVAQDGAGAGPVLGEVVDALGVPQAVAVLFVMARYVSHAVIVNSLDIGPPVSSIFDPEFVA